LIHDDGRLLTQFGGDFYSAGNLQNDAWAHAAYVWDSTANKEFFYINGNYDSEHVPSSAPTWNSAFKIGQYDLINYKYKGLIDNLALYDRALTPEEIALHAGG